MDLTVEGIRSAHRNPLGWAGDPILLSRLISHTSCYTYKRGSQGQQSKHLGVPANVEKRRSIKPTNENNDEDRPPLVVISATLPKGEIETELTTGLMYNISSYVPPHLTLMFALQQALLSLSGSLAVSLLMAEVVCAEDNDEFKAKLLSSTLFMNGVTTFFMVTLGVRTSAIAIILSLYLANRKTVIPMWSRKKSWHLIRYPLHTVFALLIAMAVGWAMCAILTEVGAFSMDRDHKDFYSRTDARTDIIHKSSWFNMPYPGQFGPMRFDISVFVSFMVATVVSILDSYGSSIGAIGLTQVASRYVFIATALIYIVFGLVGKVSAIFITIPYPVLGGILLVMFGVFNGVVLSNLQSVSLSSMRNLAIIGTSLMVGLVIPEWIETYDNTIDTGNKEADNVILALLGNPNLAGGVLACFLDNTIPGTRTERGIAQWETKEEDDSSSKFSEGYEVYNPLFFDKLKHFKMLRFLPFMPAPQEKGV
ncbi:solute carrier family 23 member 2-like [Pecten maximus]|uniref:solute carrier family 23 member 2-like n=1 Tax=Pecten maximus TaxID=6579 RepID=UPI001458BA92|nr:solute carrier family 23 member 2-like [Pecten maximus]